MALKPFTHTEIIAAINTSLAKLDASTLFLPFLDAVRRQDRDGMVLLCDVFVAVGLITEAERSAVVAITEATEYVAKVEAPPDWTAEIIEKKVEAGNAVAIVRMRNTQTGETLPDAKFIGNDLTTKSVEEKTRAYLSHFAKRDQHFDALTVGPLVLRD